MCNCIPLADQEKKAVVSTSNSRALWVPKDANSLEMKLPAEKTMLWHQRLGHIGDKGLRALKNKSITEGLNDCHLELDSYKHFIYGKQHRISFYSSSH